MAGKKQEKNNDFAVIRTGSKQYIVHEGDTLKIEKLDQEEGVFTIDDVLLTNIGGSLKVGNPKTGQKVEAEIVQVGRAKKIDIIKYKAKSRYFKKVGHRQPFAEIKIKSIK